jgi:hypothetical protein
MKYSIFFFLFIMILVGGLTAQTYIPPGNVYGTWSSGSDPYYVQGEITIPDDSTLIIEPGVLVVFEGYYALNVQGRLLAIGTATDTINFTVFDTTGFHDPNISQGGWNGIQFIDTPLDNDTSKIIFCRLQYGKAVGTSPPNNSGGAIFISNFNKVLISNCLIINNSAGGVNSPAGGGLYLTFSSIKLEENEISNNRALDGGGILVWESDPVFINNRIVSNHADEGGGGIWIGGLSNPKFYHDIILNNIAVNNGGGMVCWQTTNTTLNSVTFTGNFANWGGGVGVFDCEMQMSNCNINDNSATSLGGGLAADFSDLSIDSTFFTSDTSGFQSGAIHAWYSNLQIKHSVFEYNESDFGGAIHSEFSELQIDSSTFSKNKAIDGAGIHTSNTNMFIDSCLFFQNEASNIGGGIQYHIDTTEFTSPYQVSILNSRLIQNSGFYRGALEIQQFNSESSLVSVVIEKCEFIENTIDRGGNLFISGFIDDILISHSFFRGNTAVLRSANCFFSDHANGKVINCLFTSNQTPAGGSASSIGSGANISFLNCTFSNNSGGAVLTLRGDGHSSLLNNIFWGNYNSNIIMNAVSDTTPCTIEINYTDLQFGLDSIIVNDTISTVNWGTGNIDSDPLFVNPAGADYHLQQGSPCIGAGIDSIEIAGVWYYSPVADIEGNPRPNPLGSMPDMGAYESPLASPVGIEEDELNNIPKEYALYQNYPNPFNPITTIEFDLPQTSTVTLKIFNILGEEVTTLVSDRLTAGNYNYKWDASNMASGIYLYRLEAGGYVETRKILLMR